MILTIIGHNFFGEYLDLYITSPIFDRGLHVFGTYAFVLLTYSLLYDMNVMLLPERASKFIFVVLLGISLGTLFEIIEFLTGIMLKPEVQYQTDLVDTDLDLVCDVIGAIIAAFHINRPYGFNIKKSVSLLYNSIIRIREEYKSELKLPELPACITNVNVRLI